MTNDRARLSAALTGRYTIERELGAGGMATVYLAHDTKHDRKVALKVLKPELAAVLGGDRFAQEIKTTASLQHPHILPLFDSGTVDGFLFYVMPWIDGETLRDKLTRERQLGVDESVKLAREVADALDYAHRHGVIHRDIKPENILLHDGRPMVADFGIALALSAAAGGRMTETGLSLGTPHYMSPEQATAEKDITARSDVYSLGSVLYEMLTGNPPHTGATAQQIIMKIITEPAQPVTAFRKSVPPNVAAAVAKSVEKLPADRFESAKAFGDALANPSFAAPEARESRRASSGFTWRGRAALSRVALAALLVVIATAAWAVGKRSVSAELPIHMAFSTAPGQPLETALGRSLALSPDGHTIVYASTDSAGRNRIFARPLNELAQRAIAGTDGGLFPVFSPDGKWLAYFDGRQVLKVPSEGGTPTPLAEVGGYLGAVWTSEGILVSSSGRLKMVPVTGGAPTDLFPSDSTTGYWPASVGDHAIAYAPSVGADSRLRVVDLRSRKSNEIGVSGAGVIGVVGGELLFARTDGTLGLAAFDARALRTRGAERLLPISVQTSASSGEEKVALAAGTLVYLPGSQASEVVEVGMSRAPRILAIPVGRMNDLCYSPDGKHVAFDQISAGGRKDIWTYDIASGTPKRITTEGTVNDRPEWAPDGARLLFRSNRKGRNTSLWMQPADGSGVAQEVVAIPGKDVWEGLLAPDGKTFVFRTGTLGSADIFSRATDPSAAPRAIAATRFTEIAPRVSPDGHWIAYQSDESGSAEIYVTSFPEPGARTPISVSGGETPVWSRDGRRIYYYHGNQVFAAALSTGSSLSVASRDAVAQGDFILSTGHASFDASPDGKSLLLLRPLLAGSEQIVVITHWDSELSGSATHAP